MTICYRSVLVGLALSLGGLIACTCHLFNLDSPRDIVHLSQYARLGAPLHLVLFLGGLLVLLGWVGQYAMLYPPSGVMGSIAFACLFLGIMCGDLLHCILEFSIFPILDATAPYALPGLADATYRSTMLAPLLSAGRYLLLVGVCATALGAWRGSIGPKWMAVLFTLSAGLLAIELFPHPGELVEGPAFVALYLSLAALGITRLVPAQKRSVRALQPRAGMASTYEDSPPVVQ